MASCWPYQDYTANSNLGVHASPPLINPMAPTPLMLPRDWLEYSNCYPPGEYDDFDFQSNHLDLASSRPAPGSFSLTGLGIRNIDLAADLNALECNLPDVANTNGPTFCGDPHVPHDDLHAFSIDPFENRRGNAGGLRVYEHGIITGVDSPWTSAPSCNTGAGLQVPAVDSSTDPHSSFYADVNPALDAPNVCTNIDTYDIGLSLEELSAATGLSVADFAAQISATAEATLRNMARDGLCCDEPKREDANDPLDFQSNFSELTPSFWMAPNPLLLPMGENLHNISAWNNTCHGVNPAEILPVQSPPPLQFSLPSPCHSFLDIWGGEDNLTQLACDVQSFATRAVEAEPELVIPYRASQPNRQLTDDEQSLFQSPSSSEYSPSLRLSGAKRTLASRSSRRRVVRSRVREDPVFQTPEPVSHCDESTLPPINLGTPVLDAHRGIDIEVLKAKAERYRLRNQGRDYDKRWLISFAGKLSPRGELVDEFRCYITGCKQTNKRRDHILIHVGAHLDQRPFKCIYW